MDLAFSFTCALKVLPVNATSSSPPGWGLAAGSPAGASPSPSRSRCRHERGLSSLFSLFPNHQFDFQSIADSRESTQHKTST